MKCLCGCSKETKEGNKFIHGHNSRVDGYRSGQWEKGCVSNQLGVKRSSETRLKLSISHMGQVS